MLERIKTYGSKLPYRKRLAQNVKVIEDGRYGENVFERTSDYSYRNWFDSNHNKRIKYRQYNQAAIIDIRSLVSAFAKGSTADSTYQMSYFANTILELVNDIAFEYAENNEFTQQEYAELASLLQTHYSRLIRARTAVSFGETHSTSQSWFANLLTSRYGMNNTNVPSSVYSSVYDEFEDTWDFDPDGLNSTHLHALRAVTNNTIHPDMWDKVPLGSVGIALPTKQLIEYMWIHRLEDSTWEPWDYPFSDMLYASHPEASAMSAMSEGYYWYASGRGGYRYDNTASLWVSAATTFNRRKWSSCEMCRNTFSVKFLDWYQTRSYNTNRSRICFDCIPVHCVSYNTSAKAWILITDADQENIETARYDYPAFYRHISDTDVVPTGNTEYTFVLSEGNSITEPGSDSLPVETRRYLKYILNIGKSSDILHYRYVNDKRRRMHVRRWSNEQYSNPENTDVVANAPVDVSQVDDDISVRVWMDNLGANRNFAYVYRQRTQARIEDGWVDVDAGIELNLTRNNYSYKPPFYYVTHDGDQWLSTQTEANNRAVMNCDHCGPEVGSRVDCPGWHKQYGLFLGLELEVIVREQRTMFEGMGFQQIFERTIQTFHPQGYKENCADLMPQLLYAKYDGSLPGDSGVEYISQPMSLQAWKEVPTMFWNTINKVYKAFAIGGVGIHIHIPWSAFNEVQAYAFLSMLTALQTNENGLLRKIAQRSANNWTEWDELEYSNVPNTIAAVVKSRQAENSEKYQGINLMHDNTIELRYFNSNAKGGRVMKNLEFVTMLYDYSCLMTAGYEWDANNDDAPPVELTNIIDTFRRTEYHDDTYDFMIQDDVDLSFVPREIEILLMNYLDGNKEKYPNLWGYLTDSHDGIIELREEEYSNFYPETEEEVEEEEPTLILRSEY